MRDALPGRVRRDGTFLRSLHSISNDSGRDGDISRLASNRGRSMKVRKRGRDVPVAKDSRHSTVYDLIGSTHSSLVSSLLPGSYYCDRSRSATVGCLCNGN